MMPHDASSSPVLLVYSFLSRDERATVHASKKVLVFLSYPADANAADRKSTMLAYRVPVQDGLGIVLVRSCFRLAVWVRFFIPLGLLLGSFWVAFGLFLVHLGPVLGRLGLVLGHSGWHVGVLQSYIRINSSTYHPFNLRLVST